MLSGPQNGILSKLETWPKNLHPLLIDFFSSLSRRTLQSFYLIARFESCYWAQQQQANKQTNKQRIQYSHVLFSPPAKQNVDKGQFFLYYSTPKCSLWANYSVKCSEVGTNRGRFNSITIVEWKYCINMRAFGISLSSYKLLMLQMWVKNLWMMNNLLSGPLKVLSFLMTLFVKLFALQSHFTDLKRPNWDLQTDNMIWLDKTDVDKILWENIIWRWKKSYIFSKSYCNNHNTHNTLQKMEA